MQRIVFWALGIVIAVILWGTFAHACETKEECIEEAKEDILSSFVYSKVGPGVMWVSHSRTEETKEN